LAARLDHVVTLWEDGVAPLVVVTGGTQPGDRFTEAEASARYLVDAGVPEGAIVEVGEGSSTIESVEAAAPAMAAAGIESVALVTDPYHALRSRLIVEAEGFDVDVASTPTSVVTGGAEWRRRFGEAGGVAVGRIIGFDRLSELTG
ncbi:MAG: YdcF family protein, partial [Acidimicrobiia bacterium]